MSDCNDSESDCKSDDESDDDSDDDSVDESKDNHNTKSVYRTYSDYVRYEPKLINILRFATSESKNIKNVAIFHHKVFFRYSKFIYKDLYEIIKKNKKINTLNKLVNKLYSVYHEYYLHYENTNNFLKINNDIIYKHVKSFVRENIIVNSTFFPSYYFLLKQIENSGELKFPNKTNPFVRKELFEDILFSILKSIYYKNFSKAKDAILHHKPYPFRDQFDFGFYRNIKNDEHLFKDDDGQEEPQYKKLIKAIKQFKKLKSDQNYIARIIYRYYKNPKIPSDLMCNIIRKVYESFSSFFNSRKDDYDAKMPQYASQEEKFILPFYAQSRKEIKENDKTYIRLTIGDYINHNYPLIIDDENYVCLNENAKRYKYYVHRKFLLKKNNKKITKTNNYIVDGYYVSKKCPHIKEGYYLYFEKPKKIEEYDLNLVEIIPIYDGEFFKINYTYEKEVPKIIPNKTEKVISIDLGMRNLMTIYNPNGEQHIIKGGPLIGINENCFYHINKLQTIKDECLTSIKKGQNVEQKKREVKNKTRQIHNLQKKREDRINDFLNKTVKTIITTYKDCDKIVVGNNKGWKQGSKMGKKTNRKFQFIPYKRLIDKLASKLEEQGKEIEIIKEYYTSKCDALSFEPVERRDKYLGERIQRGLFKSAKKSPKGKNQIINADVNAAINIMRLYEKKRGNEIKTIKGKKLLNPTIKKVNIN